MPTLLQRAYFDWKELQPEPNKPCCHIDHNQPRCDEFGELISEPDELVCEREKAWRRYVRLRDGNSYWPFNRR